MPPNEIFSSFSSQGSPPSINPRKNIFSLRRLTPVFGVAQEFKGTHPRPSPHVIENYMAFHMNSSYLSPMGLWKSPLAIFLIPECIRSYALNTARGVHGWGSAKKNVGYKKGNLKFLGFELRVENSFWPVSGSFFFVFFFGIYWLPKNKRRNKMQWVWNFGNKTSV